MGLTKRAETTQPQETKVDTKKDYIGYEGTDIHPEVYKYFDINPISDKHHDKVKVINDWAFQDNGKTGDALLKLRDLELKVGSASGGSEKINKLYNWVRVNQDISKLNLRENDIIKGVNEGLEKEIKEVDESYDKKLEKIDRELQNINKGYTQAKKLLKTNATNRARNIKDKFAKRIKDLKKMRKAYGGK